MKKRHSGWFTAGFGLVLVLLTPCMADAGPVLSTPDDLNPGDTFRFLFVTTDTTTAWSGNIDDYNAFVFGQADNATYAGATVGWRAIGSTISTDARDNVGGLGTATPIYLVNGIKLTNDMTTAPGGLWSASTWLTTPNVDIDGSSAVGNVWTGSFSNGQRWFVDFSIFGLGIFDRTLGSSQGLAVFGEATGNGGAQISNGQDSLGSEFRMYGVSDLLTVPSAVPEIDPAGIGSALSLLGCGIGLLERRRRRT